MSTQVCVRGARTVDRREVRYTPRNITCANVRFNLVQSAAKMPKRVITTTYELCLAISFDFILDFSAAKFHIYKARTNYNNRVAVGVRWKNEKIKRK